MDGRALLSYASGSAAKQQVQMPKDDDEENIMDCDNDMILNKDDYELIRVRTRIVCYNHDLVWLTLVLSRPFTDLFPCLHYLPKSYGFCVTKRFK